MPLDEMMKLEYTSIGCNRTPHSLDWGKNGLIAYGACNSVILYESQNARCGGEVVAVLNAHTDRVNCVTWLNQEELLSGSSDQSLALWKQNEEKLWQCCQRLAGHSGAVNEIASLSLKCEYVVASCSADSSVRIWRRDSHSEEFVLTQTLEFGNGFVLSIELTTLPDLNEPLLICGRDDSSIQLYTQEESTKDFNLGQMLVGHEDWIRCISTIDFGKSVLLATGSQDMYIRLWTISPLLHKKPANENSGELRINEQTFQTHGYEFSITLESVLCAHEGWVFGLSWKANGNELPRLVSASMDKTIIIWEHNNEANVWMDKARMGDVGGNNLGFYGCAFSPGSNCVIGHGYQGAMHLWEECQTNDVSVWQAQPIVGGHFGSVEDLAWNPNGDFLLSVSADQTTRLHAPWRREGRQTSWHEIARPQIHGYNLTCLCSFGDGFRFAAGAEEKVLRIFEAPRSFYETLKNISQTSFDDKLESKLPLGASVPPLGLSNKAVYEGDINSNEQDENQQMKASTFASEEPAPFKPALVKTPPVESFLQQNTLWPETHKLYGHGFELFCVAASSNGLVIASACKASKAEYANILIWDTSTWLQVCSLHAHSLTVTQMQFSPDSAYLLAVSRDRTWSLFKKDNSSNNCYQLVQHTDKKTCMHTRIIWSCCWSTCGLLFFTASRDKKVICWRKGEMGEEEWQPTGEPLDVGEAATAVAATQDSCQRCIVAVGTESGKIVLHSWFNSKWSRPLLVDSIFCPALTVSKLVWRPKIDHQMNSSASGDSDNNTDLSKHTFKLTVGSKDHSLRIISIPACSIS